MKTAKATLDEAIATWTAEKTRLQALDTAAAASDTATADEKTAAKKAYDDFVDAPADDTNAYTSKKAELDAKLTEATGEITSKETLLAGEAKIREDDAYAKLKEKRDAKYFELDTVK